MALIATIMAGPLLQVLRGKHRDSAAELHAATDSSGLGSG
jgi:hypothetical protein